MTKKDQVKEVTTTPNAIVNWDSVKGKLKTIRKHPIMAKIMIIAGAILVALAITIFIFNVAYGQKIFPKTYIGGINLGGQTKDQAQSTLQNAMIASKDKKVVLSLDDKTWVIATADIDLVFDPQKSAQTAWGVGRAGGIQKILTEQLWAVFARNSRPAEFDYNKVKLAANLENIAKEVNAPEKNATIVIEELIVKIEPEQIGRSMKIDINTKLALDLFGEISPQSKHDLIVESVNPKIVQADLQGISDQTKEILLRDIVLKTDKKDFTLAPKDFASWLDFVPTKSGKNLEIKINAEKLNQYIDDIAGQIFQETKDAKFEMKGDRAIAYQSSQTGYELDKEQSIKAITEAILDHKSEVKLVVKVTEPDVSSSSASSKGIKELVAEGVTSWRGSPKNRIHNLTLGSKNISGTIVKPGEEFSTVKALGPIDLASGFLPELVIKNGTQVVPDVGGGLCQVSTTLFRAALNAGMEITQRTNHSFRVSYYEPPVGMDATIYDPSPDFRFINNMENPILIWATPTDNGLSFQIYGTKDGRNVEISDPVSFDYISPPDPIYAESATMEPGAIRQTERATRGVTASFHYKVTSASGKILQDQTFVSKYIPVPDMFLYGPGTEIPPAG